MEEKLNESDLLERVFLRLGHTDSDQKLEEFATRFLTPVLLKLSSPDEDVKKKVLELLAHINRRFKNRERVQLPMDNLFLQYQDPQCTPFVRNFTILYLKMSFLRLNSEKQLHYLPQLFLCMKEKPKPQQDCLLQLAVPVLALLSSDESSSIMKELHVVIGKDKSITESFLSFVLDVLLLPYSVFSRKVTDGQSLAVPPGLSRSALDRILAGSLTVDNLEKVKLGILRFLSADLFESLAIQVHLVVAMGDSRHSVLEYAEHQLKRITEASNWEHTSIVSKLMAIYLGTITLPGKPAAPPDDVRIPASLSLRLKIFPFLLKSRKSTHVFPACLQLIFQSLHGETSVKKLRTFGVQFIHHLCECSSDKIMAVVSPVLLSTLLKLVANNEESSLKKITYLAIGKISKRSPSLFQKDTAVIQSLFDALAHCVDPEMALAVMQSLTMVAAASKDATLPTLGFIEALILSNVSQDQPHCRLAALQVANILFTTTHVKSRYACLLASADMRDDIKEEANKGLLFHRASSHQDNVETGDVLPDLTKMLQYIYQTVHGANGYSQSYATVAGSLAYPPGVFIKVLTYLRQCLKSSAGVTKDDEVNDRALVPIKRYIQQILNTHPSVIKQYLSLIQEALKPVGTSELHSLALNSLLELLVSAPSKLGPELNQNGTLWLKDFVWSSQDVIRHTSSHVLAILACLLGKENVLNEIKQLLEAIESSSEAIQHGTVICCGHLIGQYLAQQNGDNSLDGLEMTVDDVEGSEMSDTPMEEVVTKAFKAILGFLHGPSSLLVHAACDAIGEVCRQGSIPLPDGIPLCDEDKASQATNKDKDDVSTKCETKLDVVHQLVRIMNNSKEQKLCDKSALILGLLCIEHFPHRKTAIERLLDASKKREIDLQFTVGEALSCAGAGRFSTASRSKWYTGGTVGEEMSHTKETMRWLLRKIFIDFIGSNVTHVRKAACIWLLVILKHASKHSVVQEMMGEIQQAFSSMLSENDELVQEVASKGLSLVYEFGSEEFRQSMVLSLVNTMLLDKKQVQNVTADTGAPLLGQPLAVDGSQLSTYKELCSLANEMNQPELVYRFLHLANHNALWNSKKGAAFGFASIGVQAKKELEPHLKTLVPKLYRYQFDPNSKVREAMLSIWGAIVKDPRKIIDQYSQEILNELLANLHSPIWRIRQSCCIAVSNFLNGRSQDAFIDYLPQLWSMCLRDMDDIKETVRQAAEVACKTLQSVSVRLCDVTQGKSGQQAVCIVLPVLLKHGLGTRVKEVRNLGLATIVKISKNAGSLLKPHIPVLVIALLESLSGLEPQELNYVSFHIQNNPDNQEKLEDIRIGASKSSPMMETITLCVQHIDSTVLPDLIPPLADLLRSGLGLGTKAGCAGLVVSLVQQCSQELQPYAGKLLSALLSGTTDKSQSVRRKYADAIGQLAKVAKDTSISKLFAKMKVWYLEKEDTNQGSSGLVCYAIARSAPDVLSNHAATILPLAFVAMHRKTDNGKKSPWEDIWEDNTSGTARGIQLYLEEIITISSSMLSDRSWEKKVEAAQSIQTVVRVLHTALPKRNLDSLVSALTSSLSGRTWDGKENVVSSLALLYSKCYELLDETAIQGIVSAILKECRKEKPSYKANAIKCLGQILQKKKTHDFKEVFDILRPIVDPDNDKSSSTQGDEEQSHDANLLINAFECLGLAWPANRQQQIEYRDKVLSILLGALKKNTWKIQLAVMESLKLFIKVMSVAEETEDSLFIQELVSVVLPEICQCLGNIKYAAIRVRGLEVAQNVISLIQTQESSKGSAEQINLMKELAGKLSLLRNDNNANVVEKAMELKSIVEKAIVEKAIVENSDSLVNME